MAIKVLQLQLEMPRRILRKILQYKDIRSFSRCINHDAVLPTFGFPAT